MIERLRRRLELRRSNAAAPHRNRYRERKANPPLFPDDMHDLCWDGECDCESDEL